MCPDDKLLSAFYDGEVSSPWKEQIEEHLDSCLSCRKVVMGYEAQSALLREAPEPVASPAFDELQHMIRRRNTVEASSRFRAGVRGPVFPAAAAAAAVLAFFVGFLTAGRTEAPADLLSAPVAVSEGWSVPQGDLTVSGEDINALISLLEPSDSQLFNQETNMDLPVDLNLDFYGDSQLLKPVGLSGGSFR